MTNKEKNKDQAFVVLKPTTQILTIKDVIVESTLSEEPKNKLNEMKEIEKTVDREKLYYRTNELTITFPNFWGINAAGRDIYNSTISLEQADKGQRHLLVEILNFRKQEKLETPEKKQKKENVPENLEKEFLMHSIAKYFR